jgi:hypothetical protein
VTLRTRLTRLEQRLGPRRAHQQPISEGLPDYVVEAVLHADDTNQELPADLAAQWADAQQHGRWRGTWVPLTPGERAELTAWLRDNLERLDREVPLVRLRWVQMSPYNLLLRLEGGVMADADEEGARPLPSDAYELALTVRQLRATHGEAVTR